MLAQILKLVIDYVVSFIVILLLARFHMQWLRVPFRNQIGEFVVALTNWIVLPARRVVPGLAGLDLATLVVAWALQAFALWAQAAIVGAEPTYLAVAAVAAAELVKFSVYILIFAVLMMAVLSWVAPDSPALPFFDMVTRPFLRPLRRFVPPVARIDLTPLVLLLILYIAMIPLEYLRMAAATL
jgi:YggT family protein